MWLSYVGKICLCWVFFFRGLSGVWPARDEGSDDGGGVQNGWVSGVCRMDDRTILPSQITSGVSEKSARFPAAGVGR